MMKQRQSITCFTIHMLCLFGLASLRNLFESMIVEGFQPYNLLCHFATPSKLQNVQLTPRRSLASTSSIEDTSETYKDTPGSITITTSPMKVYIEDTDAYGIIYNSNYLRSFDRALHMTIDVAHGDDEGKKDGSNISPTVQNLRGQHEGWSIVSVGQQRFKASPVLGQDFVIQGELQRSEEIEEVWDMEMISLDGAIVYNTVKDLTIQVADNVLETSTKINGSTKQHAPLHSSLMKVPPFDLEAIQPNFVCKEDYFTIYRDEIDAHWQGHLPLRNVLNLFERSRTNALGGPEGLRRLQEDPENPVTVVVTGISDLTLVEEGVTLIPGQSVAVETAIVMKRRGMVIECHQTLKSTAGTCDARLAQGKVTLMLLNAKTRRPTTKLPEWVRELLQMIDIP